MNAQLEWKLVFAGVFALVFLVHLFSKEGERQRRGLAFALGWFVPGAGHILLGKWKKGLFLFGILALTYLLGLWIVGFRAVSFDDNPFYYVGQYGSGATFLLSRSLGEEKAHTHPGIHPSWFDPGLLYVCVVGLLNLVLMMNILEIKLAPRTAAAPAPAAAPSPAPAAPPPVSPPPTEKPA